GAERPTAIRARRPGGGCSPDRPARPTPPAHRPVRRVAPVVRPGRTTLPDVTHLARRLEARMTTTTSHTPESEQPAEGGPVTRPSRLIHTESTTEIPVHLLFRDDPDPAPVPLRPAVVARRQGTGEQPRLRRPVPDRSGTTPPRVDPDLVERPARVLPGVVGVLAGVCGAAGCVATAWWAGALPPLAAGVPGLPPAPGAAGIGPAQWAACAGAGALALFGFGGLARGRTGRAWVLGLFGRYRGTVRRTGLLWVKPLLLRRRVDVRLRHWRSEPMPAA